MSKDLEQERHYFVDEAGDTILFNKYGKIIIGTEGCSKNFILGLMLIDKPHEARKKIEELRHEIVNDPYLKNVPSVKEKTSKAFHAKNDVPEVRMQVFKLFMTFPAKIYAIVRRKNRLIEEVRHNNKIFSSPYDQNELYDDCVKRIFKDRLHLSRENYITFARRGNSNRTHSLETALSRAMQNFENKTGKKMATQFNVASNYPSNEPCLQIVDYFLWALQRAYEKHEDRWLNYTQDKIRRVIDLDDKRNNGYGEYYDKGNPLALEKIKDSLKG